ncbi:MAG: MotA/TolQ/ExbB proton channel family protein [Rhodobacteraceae bacterium]|nr:MotA/TolQ/ExbB proton channel family protein [Paracoccaceae bacterium]
MIPDALLNFLGRGGPTLWIIAGLSVLTLALILWKIWRLALLGAWSGSATARAVALWAEGRPEAALAAVAGRRSLRARLAQAAMEARLDSGLSEAQAREETARRARSDLGEARRGLRALEVIATIAPLLGLLGTVLGMIAAFQTLQQAGAQADPAALAGGIWEALLTTAAGMAVAIPAGVALSWFESVTDALQADMEDAATRIFIRGGR